MTMGDVNPRRMTSEVTERTVAWVPDFVKRFYNRVLKEMRQNGI